MATPNLDIPELAPAQAQKTRTINDAFTALDNAGNDSYDVTVTGADPADVSIVAGDYTRNVRLRLAPGADVPVTAAGRFFHLSVPNSKRRFDVTNDTAVEARLKISGAASAASDPKIPAGESRSFYSDGAKIVATGGGGSGAAAAPGGGIEIENGSTSIGTGITKVRFNGNGVTASLDTGDATRALIDVPGAAPSGGGGITVYSSLSSLPAAASLAAGTRAQVLANTAPFEVMDFVVTNEASGSRKWRCIGGSSRDLVNQNVNFTANSRRVAVGSATWDYRFPYFLCSFGSPRSTPYFSHDTWIRVDAATISDLAASTANMTSGAALEVLVPMDLQTNTQNERGRVLYLGRTATNGILIASNDAAEDCYPLRIRGSA